MIILAIETSCDDTAISVVEATGGIDAPDFKILCSLVSSQTALHAEWGGVVPMLAKREHERNLPLLLIRALEEFGHEMSKNQTSHVLDPELKAEIEKILVREPDLLKSVFDSVVQIQRPKIDAIAVTYGPGLEPALWSGINFAKVLGLLWDVPVIPTNHMEGHVVSALLGGNEFSSSNFQFPTLALLVSGGHTELAQINNWTDYKILAQTRDDAAGEAFDKVARILGLPYPGGPEIAKLALQGVADDEVKLPRPMIHSKDLDFSFSGLKTAVLYLVQKINPSPTLPEGEGENTETSGLSSPSPSGRGQGGGAELSLQKKANIAREFQNSVAEVLVHKVDKALGAQGAKSFIMGGGVTANAHIRSEITKMLESKYPDMRIFIPDKKYTTDNAAMIAGAAYFRIITKTVPKLEKAEGNLKWE
ncbi:MAG: tRNA (adenosine(37)-N6)-threonylcarbamoyltransferase complex transferase subunit TsaD [Candidatus Paceibacterota bacterium]|jgi:N6-L-threonylcarbamoyladenine synthase